MAIRDMTTAINGMPEIHHNRGTRPRAGPKSCRGLTANRIGIAPYPLKGQTPCMRRYELVNGVGAP
jgi:hypothetical protein